MPLMIMPPDEVLKSLGKMTLQFAELEFYVSECLVALLLPETEVEDQKIRSQEFNRRANCLKDTLKARNDAGILWNDPAMKPPIEFTPSLTDLADQRNLLAHGIAYTALEKQDDGQLVGRSYKYSSRSKQKKSIDG